MNNVGYVGLAVGMVVDRGVLGFGLGESLEQAERVFGGQYIDDIHSRRKFLRRDYGLLELTFTGVSWVCTTLCLQAHRLSGGRAVSVPIALVSEFGAPPSYVDFDEFRSRLTGHGVSLGEAGREEEHARYMTDDMKCEVVTSGRSGRDGNIEALWSVSIW